MDGIPEHVVEKLEHVFFDTAELALELEALGSRPGEPVRYSQIEAASHRLARRLSCCLQERAVRELVANLPELADCPGCGQKCPLEIAKRTIQSIDGPVDVLEPKGHCTRCERDFFPSA